MNVSISIMFCPTIAVTYQSTAFLETDSGNFTIPLFGMGVEPVLDIDKKIIDFGVVGVDMPEFREVCLTNPTELAIRLRARSDNKSFIPDIA